MHACSHWMRAGTPTRACATSPACSSKRRPLWSVPARTLMRRSSKFTLHGASPMRTSRRVLRLADPRVPAAALPPSSSQRSPCRQWTRTAASAPLPRAVEIRLARPSSSRHRAASVRTNTHLVSSMPNTVLKSVAQAVRFSRFDSHVSWRVPRKGKRAEGGRTEWTVHSDSLDCSELPPREPERHPAI